MWLKIMGSLMIISATTAMGFGLAGQLKERPKQIRQIIGCIAALKSYIGYVATPLPEALLNCAKGVQGPIADFFGQIGTILETNGWMTPQEAIDQALAMGGRDLKLKDDEREILSVWGANLGSTSREEQQEYLNLVLGQLSHIETEAEKQYEQNARMYRYLGICGGLAVVILLI
jgi:stage III sporulation protein AB